MGGRPASRPALPRVQSGGIPPTEPQQQQQQPVAAPRPAKTGPTTFAEMGITAAKAEDKECVIM